MSRTTTANSNQDPSTYRGVWIWVEVRNGKIKDVSLELLGTGRKIADAVGEPLEAVLMGYEVELLVGELAAYGAEKVYVAEHPLLKNFASDGYAHVLEYLVKTKKPSVVLLGATFNGRELASAVAARTNAGLAADCITLDVNNERQLVQIRPDFGGKSLSAILTPRVRPQMTTVRPGVIKKSEPNWGAKCAVEKIESKLSEEDIRVKILETVEENRSQSENIENAEVIVSGGLGLKTQENLNLIENLALALKGTVGGSLAIVERGWLPSMRQIGQSGKTVSPKLYVAVGISGALQHTVGMENSDLIIAINSNPNAPIFKVATYGIVGDLFQIVPLIIKKIEEVTGGQLTAPVAR